MSSSFYAVKKGRIPGIYYSWDACLKQVDKYGGAIYKKFKALNEAELFINNNSINHIQKQTKPIPSTKPATIITKQTNRYLSTSTNTYTSFSNNHSSSTQLITEYSNTDLNKPNDHDSYILYTDGGCSGNQSVHNKTCLAGWGVVILYVKKGQCERDGDIIAQLYGPVVLDEQSPHYLGATVGTLYHTYPCTRTQLNVMYNSVITLFIVLLLYIYILYIGSNNTAELTAIGEALLWLKDHNYDLSSSSSLHVPVYIRFDSEYAAKSVLGIYNGDKNKDLIVNIRQIYNHVKNTPVVSTVATHSNILTTTSSSSGSVGTASRYCIQFSHVKGHSDNKW